MKTILKRKNLFIAVMLLCLGLFTSCTLDFETVESIEFVKAPQVTYVKNSKIPLSDFSVKITYSDKVKYREPIVKECDDKLLTITGDVYNEDGKSYLVTSTTGFRNIIVKYENVSIMVTYEVVDNGTSVTTQEELDSALDAKKGLINVKALSEGSYNSITINYPVHIIGEGEKKPVFKHISINTAKVEGIYKIEGIKLSNEFNKSGMDLITINDENPFAKVIIKNCDFNIKKSYNQADNLQADNLNDDGCNFINLPSNTNPYFNVEVVNNTFITDDKNKTAVYSVINLSTNIFKDYSRLYVYDNKIDIASRYVIAHANLSNLEIISNDIKVRPSTEKNDNNEVLDSKPSALQFTIFANSLCNIKNNKFEMNGYALNVTFDGNSANTIQKFIANLPTNNLSNAKNSVSQINILSWVHSFKTLDFGKQNLTEEQFSMGKDGKEIVLINEGYKPSREYFKIENGKYVKVEVLDEKQFLSKKETGEITHLRKNTNISWNIRFIDTNGNEQFIDPFPGDEDIYKAN